MSIQSYHTVCKFWCQNFCVHLWGPEGCVLSSGWCLDLLTWPTLKVFFIRGSWRKWTAGHLAPGCWVVQLRLWYLWFIFKTSLVLRAAVVRGLCFVTPAVPNHIRYPSLGTGNCPLNTHVSQSAYWGSLAYYAFETGDHLVKCHIFKFFMAQFFTYQSVYFYISGFSWNYNPKWSYQSHLSFSICVEKSVTSTVQPVMTYIYLCGSGMQPLHCLSLCNSSWSELKYKTGMKEPVYHWHFIK